MPNREKVIESLEMCERDGCGFNCTRCNYETDTKRSCIENLMHDALSLLKEQQPRVLSKREVYALPDKTDVWCEQRDSKRVFAMTTFGKKYFIRKPTFAMGLESNDIRFWTERPTEEQRKAVPWETH